MMQRKKLPWETLVGAAALRISTTRYDLCMVYKIFVEEIIGLYICLSTKFYGINFFLEKHLLLIYLLCHFYLLCIFHCLHVSRAVFPFLKN